MSGLTPQPASIVGAPFIKECFLNLECRYLWEREKTEESTHTLMCLEVVNICIDDTCLDEKSKERYGISI